MQDYGFVNEGREGLVLDSSFAVCTVGGSGNHQFLSVSHYFAHALDMLSSFSSCSSIWLLPTVPGWVRPFSKASGLPLCFDLSGFSFALTFPSPLLSSEQSYIFLRTSGQRWILLPKLVCLGKSSGLSEVGWYVYEELRSKGNWTSWILNFRIGLPLDTSVY